MLDDDLTHAIRLIDTAYSSRGDARRAVTKRFVRRYYATNHLMYRMFHSSRGAMHLGMDGTASDVEAFDGHSEIVGGIIDATAAQTVLELACGVGTTSLHLAGTRRAARIQAIDFSFIHHAVARLHVRAPRNLRFRRADYDHLPFPDDSFDLVFAIEGLCHSADLRSTLSESARVLAQQGVLVVFDLFRTDEADRSDLRRRAVELAERGVAVAQLRTPAEWLAVASSVGLECIESRVYSEAVLQDLGRLRVLALRFFRGKRVGRVARRLLPDIIAANAISGLLLELTVAARIHSYLMVVLRRQPSCS